MRARCDADIKRAAHASGGSMIDDGGDSDAERHVLLLGGAAVVELQSRQAMAGVERTVLVIADEDHGQVIADDVAQFCIVLARHISANTSTPRRRSMTAYRTSGRGVLDASWTDAANRSCTLAFLPVVASALSDLRSWHPSHPNHTLVEVPIADLVDALCLADCIDRLLLSGECRPALDTMSSA